MSNEYFKNHPNEFSYVLVEFTADGKLYGYKNWNKEVTVGDLVLVKVLEELKLVRVVEVKDVKEIPDGIQFKWIIDKIDYKEYKLAIKMENENVKW